MMRFCPQHHRSWQPAMLAHTGARGVYYPATQAHWRPMARAVLWQAVQVARWGHCALPMVVVACDWCAGEADMPARTTDVSARRPEED